jgi:DNA-binding NarL/FixJ family response regulator
MNKRIKILLIENSARFRAIVKEILISNFPSISIQQARNGREALIKLLRHRPDLIFMDIELAEDNGLVLTKKVKEMYPHAVIIILTHHDLPEYQAVAYQNGAQYFLSKETTGADEIVGLIEVLFAAEKEQESNQC